MRYENIEHEGTPAYKSIAADKESNGQEDDVNNKINDED